MILSRSFPHASLYLTGYDLISFWKGQSKIIRPTELYEIFNNQFEIGFHRFLLTLDWLFLIGGAKLSEDGALERCF